MKQISYLEIKVLHGKSSDACSSRQSNGSVHFFIDLPKRLYISICQEYVTDRMTNGTVILKNHARALYFEQFNHLAGVTRITKIGGSTGISSYVHACISVPIIEDVVESGQDSHRVLERLYRLFIRAVFFVQKEQVCVVWNEPKIENSLTII
ncbi:hypothetical protein BpHYR1_046299 [Brachionus plicatilis]|uniref:Uncharacterized protein n=1 Tax=Brachionus plicatilis TaxID=10195 RepID=A0A3M7SHZ0_BRAPC|nr:hypothetical protein BpHYR1_046299 [Brachionus plicatilis]